VGLVFVGVARGGTSEVGLSGVLLALIAGMAYALGWMRAVISMIERGG
jgi:hypothetical protein